MRHTVISGLVALSLSSFSDSAAAQSTRSGFYVFGAVGNSNAGIELGAGLTRDWVEGGDRGLTFGGGYEFSRHVSLEVAYQDLGDLTGRSEGDACGPEDLCLLSGYTPMVEVETAAFSVSFLGNFRITDRLDGYGRLGLTSWDFDGGSAFDRSGEDALYGAGLRWSLEDEWKVFAEYTQIDLDLDAVSVGVGYRF